MSIVYAPPNQEKTDPDYATITELKERLGIEVANVDFDDRLKVALITAEVKIEEHLGRAFPDVGDAQVYEVFKTEAPTTDIAAGLIIEKTPTLLEVSRTAYDEATITTDLKDVQTVTVGTGPYIFDVDSVEVKSSSWEFTGTIDSGSFPAPVGGLVQVTIAGLVSPDSEVIATIPETVHTKALNLAMLEFKKTDSPTGIAGADAFIGELNVNDSIRAELNDRTLLGLKIEWGVA